MVSILQSRGEFEKYESDVMRGFSDPWNNLEELLINIEGELNDWALDDPDFHIDAIGLSEVSDTFDLFRDIGKSFGKISYLQNSLWCLFSY